MPRRDDWRGGLEASDAGDNVVNRRKRKNIPPAEVQPLAFVRPKGRQSTAARRERFNGGEIGAPLKPQTRVALYLRVSGEKSVESDLSIPDQRAQLERLAAREGWLVTALYVEEGVSAKTTLRPAFRRMLSDAQIEPRPFDMILIHNTARFARRTRDYLECEELLAQRGIELRAVSQTFAKDIGG